MATTTAIVLYRGAGTGSLLGFRRLAVGGILTPSGFQPVVAHDFNFPASPWSAAEFRSSSLKPETRRRVAKALHEATLEEPEKPKKKRRAKATGVITAIDTVRKTITVTALRPDEIDVVSPPPEALSRSVGIRAPEPAPPPVVRVSIAGRGRLKGRHLGQRCGALAPAGAGAAILKTRNRRGRGGQLAPRAIENLTDEQLLTLFDAAA